MLIIHDELKPYEESINSDAVVVYPTPSLSLPEPGLFIEFPWQTSKVALSNAPKLSRVLLGETRTCNDISLIERVCNN